jgi:hypothetical protein
VNAPRMFTEPFCFVPSKYGRDLLDKCRHAEYPSNWVGWHFGPRKVYVPS